MLTCLKFTLVAVAERAVLAVRRSGLVHVQLDRFGASAMLVRPRALVSVRFNGGVWHGEHMGGRVSPAGRALGCEHRATERCFRLVSRPDSTSRPLMGLKPGHWDCVHQPLGA
jgi:hypothetical protein